MGRHYTDEQVQIAIAALKAEFPGTWERIKSVKRAPIADFQDNREKISSTIGAMDITFKKLPFLGRYDRALLELIQDVCDVAAAEVDAESPDFGSAN